jgi:hypothetical protein
MFTGIHDQQQPTISEELHKGVANRAMRCLADADAAGQRLRDQIRCAQRRQIGHPHAMREPINKPGRETYRKAGLPNAACAD